MIARIHVNQHLIRANKRDGTDLPALSVKRGGKTVRAHEVTILGPSRVIYSPDKPLSCGARCWIETEAEIELDGRG